jgi:hypothetical protein
MTHRQIGGQPTSIACIHSSIWSRPVTKLTGNGVQHTKKSKFYTKNIKNKKAWFSTQSNIIYLKKK